MYWPRRIIERRRDARQGRKRSGTRCEMQEFAAGKFHLGVPHELEWASANAQGIREPMSIFFPPVRRRQFRQCSKRVPFRKTVSPTMQSALDLALTL